ncbi:MAG: arginine deiminase-related protein [Candidatus Saccharibacteria bacterium]|nr:arginine deiminase-related protein [Candidatus Saccharibacteria bacterium]
MCAPKFFDIEYEINPWMDTNNPVQPDKAAKQWQKLYAIYSEQLGWDVQLIDPVEHLPDMVFTANGALLYKGKVALPLFRQPDRQPETPKFETWFREAGYTELFLPKYDFEGEGDALIWNDILFAGYPWRTDKPAHAEVADFLGIKTISLQLIDPRFYHLDTALTIVSSDTVALYPKAFSEESLKQVRAIVPHVIEATDADAVAYGLNAMSDGTNIVIPENAHDLIAAYKANGMNVITCPISEFQKSGGGVKCLTLELK